MEGFDPALVHERLADALSVLRTVQAAVQQANNSAFLVGCLKAEHTVGDLMLNLSTSEELQRLVELLVSK